MQFPSTHWSSISLAAKEAPDGHRLVLGNLLARYTPALRAHLRFTKRLSSHDVDDILQAFITDKILHDGLLLHAKQAKGRFRSFLLKTLDNFVISSIRKEQSNRRLLGSLSHCSDSQASTVDDYSAVFDAAWGREVIAQALEQLKEECEIANRLDIWKVFECRLLRPALYGQSAGPCEELADQLALANETKVSNLLITAKRAFNRTLQSIVSKYAAPGEILSEIRELQKSFDLTSLKSWPQYSTQDDIVTHDHSACP